MSDDVQDWRAVLDGRREWAVVLGDCLDVLRELPAGSVDAVVTDPPYGIAYSSDMGGKFKRVRVMGDLDVAVRDRVLDVLDGVPALVFGSWKAARPVGTRHVLTWEKGDHVGMGDLSTPWRPNTEEVYVIGRGFVGHRGSSVLRFNAPSPNFTPAALRYHPTEKPVPLMRALIDKCPFGLILDPFAGSGTTGVACLQTGRRFIGVEIDPTYHAIAVDRMTKAAAARQPMLPFTVNE